MYFKEFKIASNDWMDYLYDLFNRYCISSADLANAFFQTMHWKKQGTVKSICIVLGDQIIVDVVENKCGSINERWAHLR